MRTQDEIQKRFDEKKKDAFFGFNLEVLLDSMDFEHAKPRELLAAFDDDANAQVEILRRVVAHCALEDDVTFEGDA